jgi:hypothetical protein
MAKIQVTKRVNHMSAEDKQKKSAVSGADGLYARRLNGSTEAGRYDAEFAGELTRVPAYDSGLAEPEGDALPETNSRTLGWISLAMAIASLFVLPQWFGLAGIVLGGAAWMTGSRNLGMWSIVICAISLAAYFVLIPSYL